MTDQCKHCTLRGDLVSCKAAECFHHENWYAIEQQKLIDLTQAKYAAVCQELECASKDIELRDREIAALKGEIADLRHELYLEQGQ